MKRDRELYNLERKYIEKEVYFYWSDLPSRTDPRVPKYGPYEGIVLAITNNEAEATDLGLKSYSGLGEAIISTELYPGKEILVNLKDVYLIN